jgi:hypothetical protein
MEAGRREAHVQSQATLKAMTAVLERMDRQAEAHDRT